MRKIRRALFFSTVTVAQLWSVFSMAVEPFKKDDGKGLYHFLMPTAGVIWVKDMNGQWIQSEETVFFKDGDYVKVKEIGVDGKTAMVELPSDPTKDNEPPTMRVEIPLGTTQTFPSPVLPGVTAQSRSRNIHRLETGRVNFMGRLLGQKGREDAIVYVDGDIGQRKPLWSEPGPTETSCDEEGRGKCVKLASTADPLTVVDSKVFYTLDKSTGEYRPQLFYRVAMRECRDPVSENCRKANVSAMGWIDASEVTTVRRTPAYNTISPYHPTTSQLGDNNEIVRTSKDCKDPLVRSAEEAKEVTEMAAKTGFDNNVLGKVGDCLATDYVHKVNNIEATLLKQNKGRWNASIAAEKRRKIAELGRQHFGGDVNPFERFMRRAWELQPQKDISGSGLRSDQLLTLDSMARTLYGELRSCSSSDPGFYKAVARVLVNRAALVKADGTFPPFVKDPITKGQPVTKILPKVQASSYQISSWNQGDMNLKVNLCPLNKATERDTNAWKMAVMVAWQVLTQREKFLEETKTITETHYSSGMIPSWSNSKKQRVAFEVSGRTYENSRCLILWGDENNDRIRKLQKNIKNFALQWDGIEGVWPEALKASQ